MVRERIDSVPDEGARMELRLPRRTRMVMIGVFFCLFPLLVLTCASAPQTGAGPEKLVGTWMNKEFFGTYFSWKLTYDSQGKALNYRGKEEDPPSEEGRYTIEKRWIDSHGSTWYHIRSKWGYLPYNEAAASANHWYTLAKIGADGSVLEYEESMIDYPSEFGALGGRHFVMNREAG
jgi:hypothetical protein